MQATTITLIGAGNVATQLGIALQEQGYAISQVYSPTKKSAEALAKKLNAAAITDLKKLLPGSVIYIIAVKDDAIEAVAKQLHFSDQIVVHTSGTVPIDVLKKTSKNYGVLYPLQTFSKGKTVDLKTTPVCIEANNKSTSTTLQYFAKSFSGNVQQVSSGQRKTIHLAAVFACNFSNHLYAVAEGILKKDKLSLDLLQPLIEETAAKIKGNSPVKMQTGPAVRGDKKTMEAHLKLISDADTKKIYQLISKGIIKIKNK
jgi:predicted short-subunit dehydrogenase-like oxidoreductase (DUF2520 family)